MENIELNKKDPNDNNEIILTDAYSKPNLLDKIKDYSVDTFNLKTTNKTDINDNILTKTSKNKVDDNETNKIITVEHKCSEKPYINKQKERIKQIPFKSFLIGNLIILIIFFIYSMFPRPFLNLDISFICILSMIGLNWFQRLRCGQNPKIEYYNFIAYYMISGIYSLIPIDLVPDMISIIGSLDDVIVVWIIVLFLLLKLRKEEMLKLS